MVMYTLHTLLKSGTVVGREEGGGVGGNLKRFSHTKKMRTL